MRLASKLGKEVAENKLEKETVASKLGKERERVRDSWSTGLVVIHIT